MKGKLEALKKLSDYVDGMEEGDKEGSEMDEQLKYGIECEMKEHDMPEEEARKIAQEHLDEDPEYYKKEEESEMDPNEEHEVEEMGSDSFGSEESEGEEEPKLSISVLARNKGKSKGKFGR